MQIIGSIPVEMNNTCLSKNDHSGTAIYLLENRFECLLQIPCHCLYVMDHLSWGRWREVGHGLTIHISVSFHLCMFPIWSDLLLCVLFCYSSVHFTQHNLLDCFTVLSVLFMVLRIPFPSRFKTPYRYGSNRPLVFLIPFLYHWILLISPCFWIWHTQVWGFHYAVFLISMLLHPVIYWTALFLILLELSIYFYPFGVCHLLRCCLSLLLFPCSPPPVSVWFLYFPFVSLS